MPIMKQCTSKVVFNRLDIDAVKGTATAYFTRYIDDVKLEGEIAHFCGPELVVPLLQTPGNPTLSRSFDIAIAVYNLAIQQGWFVGDII